MKELSLLASYSMSPFGEVKMGGENGMEHWAVFIALIIQLLKLLASLNDGAVMRDLWLMEKVSTNITA